MGTINIHEFVSLDGVFEDPSWTAGYRFTDEMMRVVGEMTEQSSAILLGRSTYQMFAPAWSGRTVEDDPGAPFFNDTPKHVVSATLNTADDWKNSTILGPYSRQAVQQLKDQVDGGIYVSGSGTLVRALLADGLVDQLHLLVYPIVLGKGQRLLGDGAPRCSLSLAGHEAFDNGVLHLTYTPART